MDIDITKAFDEIQEKISQSQSIIFVYKKDNYIKVLNYDFAIKYEYEYLKNGYTHIATLDAVTFIEYMSNNSKIVRRNIESDLFKRTR